MKVWARRAAAEGIGTFFLVLIGAGAAAVNAHTDGAVSHPGVALAFAFVVIAMIYAMGHLSGAHINPAVTIAFWSVRRFPGREIAPYLLAQCAGATLGALAICGMVGDATVAAATVPAIPIWPALLVESLLSFALMFVIMSVATDVRAAPGFAGVAVGLTVGFDAMMGGPLTGASMNPARSLGPAVVTGVWDAHWIYWLAPILAMIAAAHTYEFLRPARVVETSPVGVRGPLDEGIDG